MSEHILDWLPAYHDGELNPSRQRQVEKHLQTCPDCRAELKAIQDLSAWLQTSRVPQPTSPERFAAQVQLRLPRKRLPTASQQPDRLPRWVLFSPLALIMVWAFLEAALWITYAVLQTGWIFGLQSLLNRGWNPIETAGSLLLLNLGLLIGTSILWTLWLACWWLWHNNKKFEISSQSI